MSKKASPALLGGFVLGAIALVIAAVIVLGSGRLFRDTRDLVVYFDDSVGGLSIGSPVKFKGITLGEVKDVRLNLSRLARDPGDVRIPVVLEIDLDRLEAEGAVVDLDDPAEVVALVDQGLRARLETESLITGQRYIGLDMVPGSPADLVADPSVDIPEIPVLPTGRERIMDEASTVLERLAAIDYEALSASIQGLVEDTRELVASPGLTGAVERLDRVIGELSGTLVELRRVAEESRSTAAAVNTLLDPEGLVTEQLGATLEEMQLAARSVRRLSEQLERDPGSLVRGGQQQ